MIGNAVKVMKIATGEEPEEKTDDDNPLCRADGRDARVLSENGITNALLGGRSGASKRKKKAAVEAGANLPLFVAPRQLEPFISNDLIDGPLKQIRYRDGARHAVENRNNPFWKRGYAD